MSGRDTKRGQGAVLVRMRSKLAQKTKLLTDSGTCRQMILQDSQGNQASKQTKKVGNMFKRDR